MENKRLLVSLYDGCQYKCEFCMYGFVKENHPLSEGDSMGEQQWYGVLKDAHVQGFRVLEVGGRGEPTLSPVFTKVLTKAHELGYEINLLSNALKDKVIIEVLSYLKRLTININAVDEQAMDKIHQPLPGFSFERCLGLVKNVVSAVVENGFDIQLKTNYVVTRHSLKEAFSFPEKINQLMGSELGKRRIHINYQHVHDYIKSPEYLGFDHKELQKVLLLARLNSSNRSLVENSNLTEFIAKTEKLIERITPFSENSKDGSSLKNVHYTCEVHHHVLFVDGNGDCYGCYNPFRAVNGLPIEKDPFYFGNLLRQKFSDIVFDRKEFDPVMDVSKVYWRPCLLCKAKECHPQPSQVS